MLSDTGFAAHLCRAGGLQLNITIYLTLFWNTIYMDKAASHLAKTSATFDPALLPHTSPLGWDPIILSGNFDWHSGAAERQISRPLHIRSAREWKND